MNHLVLIALLVGFVLVAVGLLVLTWRPRTTRTSGVARASGDASGTGTNPQK